jgi:MOSC domain-containing protein YiiM
MAKLDSINVGQPRPIPTKSAKTGIYKEPVPSATLTAQGIEGDAVMDRKHHGGVDQAVYLYFADDYAWWSKELGETVAPGTFGDNLTISGVEGRSVAVGDRFTIGSVVLEVTSHRTPCLTFALRMGDAKFVRRFHRAGRPGAYCRVITPGSIEAGKPVTCQPFAGERITVSELMKTLDGARDVDPAFLRRALAAPVHYKMRTDFESRLARLF